MELARKLLTYTFGILAIAWIVTHPRGVSATIGALSKAYNSGVSVLKPEG